MDERLRRGMMWSGAGHGLAILWILLGDWLFSPSATPDVIPMQVSMISSAEFDAMQSTAPRPAEQPEPGPAPDATAEPEVPPPPTAESSPRPPEKPPAPPVPPEATPLPESAPPPEPVPDPAEAPVTAPSDLAQSPEAQPLPSLSTSLRPRPKPADRVAPRPVDVPEDATTSDTPEAAVSETPTETPQQPQEARKETAPEESGDVLKTEATERQDQAMGMTTSPLPRARPAKPKAAEPAASTVPAAAPGAAATDDAIAAALAEAAAGDSGTAEAKKPAGSSGGASGAKGPPLNAGEMGDIASAIGSKWNLGAVSTDVLRSVVVVRVAFDPSGKPVEITLVERDAPTAEAAQVAFEAARRAIQRAWMDGGIPLPPDKYETWKVLEFVFDANGMRLR